MLLANTARGHECWVHTTRVHGPWTRPVDTGARYSTSNPATTEMFDRSRVLVMLVCNQPLRPTQLPTLSGVGNGYRQRHMLFGWEGNCRSGVALVVRHRLCGISTYGISGLTEGDEHPAYAPVRLSLLPSAGRELSTGHGAVMLFGWGSEGMMAHSG